MELDEEPMLFVAMKRAFKRDPTATTAINYADPNSGHWPLTG